MEKENVEVVIMGKVYTIAGDENKEFLQRIARYMDDKMQEVSKSPNFNRMSMDYKNLMINLNVAYDYFKAQDWSERLEHDKEKTQKEILKLKERIVDLEMQLKDNNEEILALKEQLDEK
ncbi:MAG: cell division protein ZapA [Eubacteriales bacterium]|nr:cell division protein ZapA [Eubacteriales bacterium]